MRHLLLSICLTCLNLCTGAYAADTRPAAQLPEDRINSIANLLLTDSYPQILDQLTPSQRQSLEKRWNSLRTGFTRDTISRIDAVISLLNNQQSADRISALIAKPLQHITASTIAQIIKKRGRAFSEKIRAGENISDEQKHLATSITTVALDCAQWVILQSKHSPDRSALTDLDTIRQSIAIISEVIQRHQIRSWKDIQKLTLREGAIRTQDFSKALTQVFALYDIHTKSFLRSIHSSGTTTDSNNRRLILECTILQKNYHLEFPLVFHDGRWVLQSYADNGGLFGEMTP